MIRELLVASGLLIAWTVASGLMVFLAPWAGVLFAIGISVLPLVVHVWMPFKRGREDKLSALRARSLPGLRTWIFATVLLTPVLAVALVLAYNQLLPMSDAPPDIFTTYAEQEGGWLAVAILTVLFTPIVEEFVLRGWFQGSFERRVSPAVAIVMAAFLYALLHFSAEGLPLYFGIGVLFGWAVWQSGSIWAGVLLHGSYNASLLAASALQKAEVGPFSLDMEVGGVGIVLLLAAFVVATGGVVHLGLRAGGTRSGDRLGGRSVAPL